MKYYRGNQIAESPVLVVQGDHAIPLPVVPYPYERHSNAHTSIAWWQNHDAAIRLAASLLVDATEGGLDPYTLEVTTQPQIAGIAVDGFAPVTTYLARAFAYEIISGFGLLSFEFSQHDVVEWLRSKAVDIPMP